MESTDGSTHILCGGCKKSAGRPILCCNKHLCQECVLALTNRCDAVSCGSFICDDCTECFLDHHDDRP